MTEQQKEFDWNSVGLTKLTVPPMVSGASGLDQVVSQHRSAYEKGVDPMTQPDIVKRTDEFLAESPDNEGKFINMMNESQISETPTREFDWDEFVKSPPRVAPSVGREVVGAGLDVAGKVVGSAFGLANSPSAFFLGYMSAETYDPKEFYKTPWWQQAAIRLGSGFVSAAESIATPGKWGVTFPDYYKKHMGVTIEQDLASGFKELGVKEPEVWAKRLTPTVEMIGGLITDPSLALVPAAQLARLKVPKGFVGDIPKHIIDQIGYLDGLNDLQMKRRVAHTLRKAYDARLWGIKEGATFQNVRPAAAPPSHLRPEPVVKETGPGGIIAGETFQNVGPKVGVAAEGTRMPGTPISGEKPLGPTTMGQAGKVPVEPSTVPEAARRIMEAAKLRTERYIAEGNLAKKSGVTAMGFINKVRKRLGLPYYDDVKAASTQVDELYGVFAEALMSKSFNRAPSKDVEFFDLGALVRAAKEVFGPDDTIRALKVIEAEDSEIGRTLKAAMPELERTLGSGQFTEPLVLEGKVVSTRVKPPVGTEEAPKVKPPVTTKVTVPPKVEPPVTPAARGTQIMQPKSSLETPEPGMRVAEKETDIFDDLMDAGVTVDRPIPQAAEELIVPGKSFKHVVPKKGEHIAGVGDIIEVKLQPDKNWWVIYLDETTGHARLKKMDEVMSMAKGQEVPKVTLDMLGFQNMFDDLTKRIRIIRAEQKLKVPFQTQIPPDKLLTPDWDKVVKHRRTTTYMGRKIFAPEVRGLEKNIAQNMNDIPEGTFRELFENPIRNFEYMGPEATEMFYRPIKEGEHAVAVERRNIDQWMKSLRNMISFGSRKRIGTYATAQQRSYVRDPKTKQMVWFNDGLERLKAMGVTDIPVLNDKEMQVYTLMRKKLDEFYLRLNAARVASGHAPFPKVENYFTFMHDFSKLEAKGVNPMLGGIKSIEDDLARFIHPTATPFKYAKHRGRELFPLELDAFTIMEKYLPQAIKHVHMSPRIAKIRELSGIFEDAATGDKWQLSRTHPNAYKFINEWLTYQAGIQQGTVLLHGWLAKAVTALNKNMTFALLSGNLRTMLIQPSAFVQTVTEIGPKYFMQGVVDLAHSMGNKKLWSDAFGRSNVLLGRAYDVSMQQAMDAVRSGALGHTKQLIGKAGMKPIQWLDIGTAWATWRGAYRKGIAEGLSNAKAANYADDVVVRTQASGAPSDIAKIQRSGEGRMLTLLQTFVINQWNFFVRDVLGMGNPRLVTKERFEKMGKLLVATTLTNVLYEDVLGMNSPFPTPIRAFAKAIDEGEELPSASWQAAKELAEQIPMVGGAIRYSQGTPWGPVFELGEDISKIASEGKVFSPKAVELAAKALGVPGTAQVTRAGREYNRGEPPWTWLAGKRTIETKGGKTPPHW